MPTAQPRRQSGHHQPGRQTASGRASPRRAPATRTHCTSQAPRTQGQANRTVGHHGLDPEPAQQVTEAIGQRTDPWHAPRLTMGWRPVSRQPGGGGRWCDELTHGHQSLLARRQAPAIGNGAYQELCSVRARAASVVTTDPIRIHRHAFASQKPPTVLVFGVFLSGVSGDYRAAAAVLAGSLVTEPVTWGRAGSFSGPCQAGV